MGQCVASLNPYTLTAVTSLAVALRVAGGALPPGSHTPGAAFGADFVIDFDGVTRQDTA